MLFTYLLIVLTSPSPGPNIWPYMSGAFQNQRSWQIDGESSQHPRGPVEQEAPRNRARNRARDNYSTKPQQTLQSPNRQYKTLTY